MNGGAAARADGGSVCRRLLECRRWGGRGRFNFVSNGNEGQRIGTNLVPEVHGIWEEIANGNFDCELRIDRLGVARFAFNLLRLDFGASSLIRWRGFQPSINKLDSAAGALILWPGRHGHMLWVSSWQHSWATSPFPSWAPPIYACFALPAPSTRPSVTMCSGPEQFVGHPGPDPLGELVPLVSRLQLVWVGSTQN